MYDYWDTVKGHFTLEVLDKNNKVLDVVDGHNMIMAPARKSMSEIFANINDIKFAHKLVLGTRGCIDSSEFTPRDEYSGFEKTRDRLFSEPSDVFNVGDVVPVILFGDIITINSSSGPMYYEYVGTTETEYVLTESALADALFFKSIKDKPYTHTINFKLPRYNVDVPSAEWNTDHTSVDAISVQQKDTSVIFSFILDSDSGNSQFDNDPQYLNPTSKYNEAGIYVNNRLFCMKTFSTKVKDNTIKFKITWTITF